MEFNAHSQLLKLDALLQDLLPNRLATSRPPTFKMLQALSTIDLLEVVTPLGSQFLLNKLSIYSLKSLQLLDVLQLVYAQALPLSKFQPPT